MENEMVGRLIDLANRDYNRLTVELSDGETYNTGHMASYVAVLFKMAFAKWRRPSGWRRQGRASSMRWTS